MSADPAEPPAGPPAERSLLGRRAGVSPPEVTAQVEREVVAAVLALRHRAGPPPSAVPDPSPAGPEAGWRRTRLAALGLLPRFPVGPGTHRD